MWRECTHPCGAVRKCKSVRTDLRVRVRVRDNLLAQQHVAHCSRFHVANVHLPYRHQLIPRLDHTRLCSGAVGLQRPDDLLRKGGPINLRHDCDDGSRKRGAEDGRLRAQRASEGRKRACGRRPVRPASL